VITERDALIELERLNRTEAWPQLKAQALVAANNFPRSGRMAAYVAHAMRKLDELADGWTWACRGVELDPEDLFAINRKSLLGVLTRHDAEVYALAKAHLDRVPTHAADAQNLAVTIVNAILAASRLGTIPEAVELFTPIIVRLDHEDLHFNSACLYALGGDERVWTYMAKSLATLKPKTAFDDADFDAVRADPRFAELMARDWDAERAALERAGKELNRAATRGDLRPEHFVDPRLMQHGPANTERNAELERAIDADIDDPAGYLVYSDWLQERNNARGMLVLASRRCDEARTEGERMLAYLDWGAYVAGHAGSLLGTFAHEIGRKSRLRWRHGFVAELGFDTDWAPRVNAPAVLRTTLALPAFRFLRVLSIGDLAATDELDYAPIVDVIFAAELPHLRALAIEPRAESITMTSLDISELSERFPALEALVVGAGELDLGRIDLPRLRRLAVHSGALDRASFAAVCSARVPALEDLEVWFGFVEYGGAIAAARALAPLLGKRQPTLRRLGLKNANFTDEMIEPLARSLVLPQLTELDLAMGTLSDEGAGRLLLHARAFAHLARLDVSDNAIGEAMREALREALPHIVIGTQKRARYVTVAE
jgi:uncharacterized protein (TIGR02996 family)